MPQHSIHPIHSSLEKLAWPGLVNADAAQMLSMLYQLEQTQWWSPEQLWEHQRQQLQVLLQHAFETSPFYRHRLEQIGYVPGEQLTRDRWAQLPLLTRQDLRKSAPEIKSQRIPAAHGQTSINQTSGSTGESVKVHGTALNGFFWRVFTLREHLWHQRDFSGTLAVIRASGSGSDMGSLPHGNQFSSWGPPTNLLYQTGRSASLSVSIDVKAQAIWLQQQNPDYLLTYPSNLDVLIEHCQTAKIHFPKLREVRTIGEMLTPRIREACQRAWGIKVVDTYSSQEIGYMALQCPECEQYHVQSEGVLIEVLDDQNNPCKPGEIGRVVVTNLHNFAMPLIRYEIKDYAVPGTACICGRGLPTLERIVGRERNMVRLPTGEVYWPLTAFKKHSDIAPIIQYQLVQRSLTTIEMRLVVERSLNADQERQLVEVTQEALNYPFEIVFNYLDEIPKKPNGKFEEFMSELNKF